LSGAPNCAELTAISGLPVNRTVDSP